MTKANDMDRDALLALLRAELSVSVTVEQRTEFGPRETLAVSVTLRLGDDDIGTSTDSVTLPDPR